MNENDLAFIRKAMDKRWLFWCYFWRWPNLLSKLYATISESPAVQVKDIYPSLKDMEAERDAAVAALRHMEAEYNAMLKAQKRLLKWIHTTHRLSNVPVDGIRALFSAGKRLKVVLLFFFMAVSMKAQVPPLLRNHWTTNSAPRAITTLLTNGVRLATNIWELDLTNSATVTITAISNANKAIISFAGAASGGAQVWTNDSTFIYPSGSGTPGLAPGPPIMIRSDGSTFTGTNVTGDVNIFNFARRSPLHCVSVTDSNEPPEMAMSMIVKKQANYVAYSEATILVLGDKDAGYVEFSADVKGTNGLTDKVKLRSRPDGSGAQDSTSLTLEHAPLGELTALRPAIAEAAGVVPYLFDTAVALTNMTLMSVLNAQVEKFHVGFGGAIYSAALSPSTILKTDGSTNITSLANGTGALTNDGSGNLGWGSAGSSGISSVYSNNVLAGSSLTQLEFTNTSTVTVAISSNANRAIVSLTAVGDGVGIATQGGSGTNTTLVTFSSITGTNATAQTLNVTSTQTNTGVIGQTAPLQQWNNSNATQSASIASNGVLVLQSNIVSVLFGPGASVANVGLKNSAGVLQARTGSDSTYASFSAGAFNSFDNGSGFINRGGVGSAIGFNGQWFFSNPAQGVAEIYNDTGTAAMTNRVWGSRTNSTTGWWMEDGYAADFGWQFLRTRSGTSAAKSLVIGVSTNADLVVDTAHKVSVGTGVADGGGLKHGRVTTGSIGIGSTALVTLTWASAFADANYTVSAEVEDSTTTSLALSVVHVESKTTTNVAVRIINNSATTAITGTLNVLALHD